MNLRMGRRVLMNVQIPLLWGERAIIQDKQNRISIIDLSGDKARVEVLADEPAPGVSFLPLIDGIEILDDGVALYIYNPLEKTVSSLSLGLPEVHISAEGIRIGSNLFSGKFITGSGVGMAVRNEGISLGGPLPSKLAKLELR